MKYEVSFVLPCLNEKLTIEDTIKEIQNVIKENNLKAEIIVVDNGSTDDSAKIAKKCGASVYDCKEKGYGNALRYGFFKSNAKFIIMGDADTTYDFHDSIKMLEKLNNDYDFVIGNRYKGGMEKEAMSLSHYYGVKFLSWIGRKKYKVKIGDFHCGIRGVKTSLLSEVEFNSKGMEFATEMIKKFKDKKICEVPAKLRKCKKIGRDNHLRTVRDGFRHLWFILKD